ncbi:hybrid sensor histidine kinase/response regulator [Methylobacterium sp. WSM2598]|uniref:hybrid sensor histidine kinase/response regulator n=1 Tax=Methylobacterium sp. WSM2598 TaxID=398261 RepID=UPI000373DECF|nr:hybrid sensor histidine kinase/response regulator [Methylobacterium sp. WSM2598]
MGLPSDPAARPAPPLSGLLPRRPPRRARLRAGWDALRRLPRRSAFVLTALLPSLLILAAAGGLVLEMRQRALDDAQRELATLNTVLAEDAARTLQSVNLVLQSVIDLYAAEGIATPEEFARLKAGRDTHDLLRGKLAGVPQLDAVTLVAADGHLINFSRGYPIPPINLSDRDYFAHLRDTPLSEPYVTEPVQNRGNGTWTFYLARRLAAADGRFMGLVLGAIDLSYFDRFYRSLNLGGQAAISLWRRDGVLMTREPPVPGVGRQFRIRAFEAPFLEARSGFYEISDSMDGLWRLVSTRSTRDYALVVNVTRTRDEVLAGWHREAILVASAALACVAAVILIVLALKRQMRADAAAALAATERARAVTAREEAEAQLRQAQKMEAVGQLTGGIAHDFNNLLTGIIGSLDMMQTRLAQGRIDTLERYARTAMTSANRAAALTHRLLAFARRQPLDPKPVEAGGLVAGMEDLLRRSIGEAVRLEIVTPAHLWVTLCDPPQLESAILNLAINARDAMPEGGRLTIETANAVLGAAEASPCEVPPGEYVCIRVADTGTGMPPEVMARAVEPFFTTKPIGQGTGLGLSMVYGFARQSEGCVAMRSEVGRGTEIRLYLPRYQGPDLAEAGERAAGAIRRGRGETVLIVDDETAVRGLIVEVLEDLGYRALEAADGPGGLAILTSETPIDLLVTDIGLPGLDGRRLADLARAARPGLKVLFITGYAETAARAGGMLAPGMELLTKPFPIETIATRIRTMIEG